VDKTLKNGHALLISLSLHALRGTSLHLHCAICLAIRQAQITFRLCASAMRVSAIGFLRKFGCLPNLRTSIRIR